MATRWFAIRKLLTGIAAFTVSLAISGCEREPVAPAGLLTSREARLAGAKLYAANCVICHGVSTDGRGQRREGMNPPPTNLTLPPWSEEKGAGRTFLAIRNGVPQTAMAGWPMLSDQQTWELAAYIISLKRE